MIEYGATAADLASVYPEIVLTAAGILILLADAVLPRLRELWPPFAAMAVVGAWVLVLAQDDAAGPSFGGLLESTLATGFLAQVILLTAFLSLLAASGYLRRENLTGGEYPALLLWCVVGLLLLVRSTELLTLFLSLELLSFCLYALAAYHRRLPRSTEAGLKYFLMGAFVSAFFLLGIALLYGETGSTRLDQIATNLFEGAGSTMVLTLGFLLLVCGLAFKMSLAPFHAWSPDTYEGAPSPFVAFLSVAPKIASAYVLLRLLGVIADAHLIGRWPQLIAALSVLSILVGNLLALVQKDLKRMLAYSGIAHMGYLLIPLAALGEPGVSAVLVYALAYALMNAGAFAVVALLYARPGEPHLLGELAGWGYRFPLLGFCLTVLLLSLGGIPPTLGFLGKYLVFSYALESGLLGLALVGIAGSLIGIFYYLRVVYILYMRPETRAPEGLLIDGWGRLAVVLATLGTLLLGLFPAGLLAFLQGAPPS